MVGWPQACRPQTSWPEGWRCWLLLSLPPTHQNNAHKLIMPSLNTYYKTCHYLPQVETHCFEGMSPQCSPLPGKAIKLSSTSPKTLSSRFDWTSMYREAELLASLLRNNSPSTWSNIGWCTFFLFVFNESSWGKVERGLENWGLNSGSPIWSRTWPHTPGGRHHPQHPLDPNPIHQPADTSPRATADLQSAMAGHSQLISRPEQALRAPWALALPTSWPTRPVGPSTSGPGIWLHWISAGWCQLQDPQGPVTWDPWALAPPTSRPTLALRYLDLFSQPPHDPALLTSEPALPQGPPPAPAWGSAAGCLVT